MAKNAHLTFDERQTIEVSLRDNLKFKEIGEILGKDPSTISKEVRNHYKVVEKRTYNPCANRRTCKHYGDICKPCKKRWGQDCKKCDPPCYTHCPDFEEQVCLKIKKPPYVCNGCDTRQGCKLRRHLYEAKYAQNEYEAVRSESRQGFAISSEELKRIDGIITPLIRQGQSIHQICVNNVDLIMLDEKTIYNYIDAGLLSVCNGDLPRKVRYRIRKKKKPVRVDKKCHVGRTYEDFQEYMAANPDVSVVEMDSVEGRKGGCEVCHEMIRRVLPKKTSFDNLIQEDVSLLMSHINSYTRKKLNDQSANQLFSFLYGEDTLAKLGIKVIPANEINLTPYLLKK